MNTMAASLSLTQLSSGNPVYEKNYRQVDPTNSGRVGATEAALFLKKSGLADLILGKIWDLADTERKGFLSKQEFFVVLRLIACAQNGLEVSLSSLSLAVSPPVFHDTSSPLLVSGAMPSDVAWSVKPEEKLKFDTIFDSLGPVKGMLSGDKVKPVLLNSKLPVDVLGRVWELSDIDRDGMLDRDEFAVAMYLVYRALEKEPVPMSLPAALVPPSKRKKATLPSIVPLLPSPPSSKESRQSLPASNAAASKALPWVVSAADKAKYDEIFLKTDKDKDGLVSGPEVRDIFLKTGLPSTMLAHIWELCDTADCGKLSKEQFALALHLINQKLVKGTDPPHVLTADMIPPSDRGVIHKQSSSPGNLMADFSAIKELDSLNNEIVELQREKTSVEQDIKEKEENIKQRTGEVQDLQDEVDRENVELQRLQTQRQEIQEALNELDQQKVTLEEQLSQIRQQCTQESQLISYLQTQVSSQEQKISQYEEELLQAREDLKKLQVETVQMQEKLEESKKQLEPLQMCLRDSHLEITEVQGKLFELQESHRDVTKQLSWRSHLKLVNGTGEEHFSVDQEDQGIEASELHSTTETPSEVLVEAQETSNQQASAEHSPCSSTEDIAGKDLQSRDETIVPEDQEVQIPQIKPPEDGNNLDFFHTDPFIDSDPFKDDPFGKPEDSDPFGGDPFKGTDPFASDSFFQQPTDDLFGNTADPFSMASGKTADADLFGAPATGSAPQDPFSCSTNAQLRQDPFESGIETGAGVTNGTATGTGDEGDPFSSTSISPEHPNMEMLQKNDPFAPGGTTVTPASDVGSDPFTSVFGNDPFGSSFADFSNLDKANGPDPFSSTFGVEEFGNRNIFREELPKNPDTPPALPPKTGTPTRPPPPPPGKRPSLCRSETDSFRRLEPPLPLGSGDSGHPDSTDKTLPDPFSSFSTNKTSTDPENFAKFNNYSTEEDLIEWAKRESEREEKERLARLTQQEQEDLELAIALSKSEISEA
ncbi:epidermal growth factor receptor substrate 15 isoform X1 [Erpetoichthys calabaricus]|uniref:epidermal growth factor receptor substrate 15 isoform X1 n=1 Tax=Erpetoichthys calabaricus TaxID=27687 RepID=UPI002233E404|nr:epidermal growth factor receptor substrate 15 isoform X1 [Erpetoichthys calabaricus]